MKGKGESKVTTKNLSISRRRKRIKEVIANYKRAPIHETGETTGETGDDDEEESVI